MQATQPVTVVKFGSSVLAGDADVARAVHEIYRYYRAGHAVVAVVSALAGSTDRLLAQARRWGDEASPRGAAALLATGEAAAAALLVLALDRAGLPVALLDPRQARLRASGPLLDSEPCGVDAALLRRALARHRVVVVPGFYGETADGAVALFGRGGSDLTALFLAQRLGALECRLIKDVDGVYEHDPAAASSLPTLPARYGALSWSAAARLGGRVVQGKALAFAARHGISFAVAALGASTGTVVGRGPTRREEPAACRRGAAASPLRVALLGLGAVGLGVYRHLAAEPRRFTVAGIAVREPLRRREGVPDALLVGDPWQLLERSCDVVVETLPGVEPAAALIAAALARGLDVVTANKAVMAMAGRLLGRQAAAHGAVLLCAAAVGGAVPVLEAVARAARESEVLSIRGVLNGTCNFVLDEMAGGSSCAAAVRLAQERGFAEADPQRDLDGRDAACKLILLAHAAWGVELAEEEVERSALAGIDAASLAAQRRRGRVVRLVAECRREAGRVQASVRPVVLAARHFLAAAHGEENRVLIARQGAPALRLRGRGAGRWPTSEAVVADLGEIARRRLGAAPPAAHGASPAAHGASPAAPSATPAAHAAAVEEVLS
jgi:homoserine dehydrogenase